jgi:hypothetical protein
MISEHHNYDNGYIGLVNIELDNLAKTIEVDEYELLIKSEFHVSLLCTKNIAPLIDDTNVDIIESELVEFFLDFIKTTPLDTYSATNEFRLVKNNDRVTLVGMVIVPGIEGLFTELSKKYGVSLPIQPTHITVYTLQPEKGIGILSKEQLDEESLVVNVDIRL